MSTALQVGRNFELTIGDTKTEDAVVITPPMYVSFSVNKSSANQKRSNSAEIEVYNLPDDKINVLNQDYPVAILKVAYADNELVTLIQGEVISVSTRKQGADKVTQIQIGSGYVALNHKTIEKVVPAGKTVKEVITTLQKEMTGVSKGVFSGFNIQNKVLYGYSISGTARETLDNLCRAYHLDYNIDHDILHVYDAVGTIDENYTLAPLISESSGLIDLPYETKVAVGKAKKSVENKGGVSFQCLLNPTLQAGSIIKLESKTISGWYKLSELRHFGSNRSNDWYTDCKCEDKSSQKVNTLDEGTDSE